MPVLLRFIFVAAAVVVLTTGCTELPNDVGVHPHRPAATRARLTSDHRITGTWQDNAATSGKPRILVNLTTQQAFFYRGNLLVGQTYVSSGRHDFETPPGKYRVIQKEAHHVSSQFGEYLSRSGEVLVRDVDLNHTPRPPGARFVGAPMPYFLRFTEGYGIHAGYVPQFRASHGCIRLPPEMAQHFFEAAEIGTPVDVVE